MKRPTAAAAIVMGGLLFFTALAGSGAWAQTELIREYEIKAAFIYNFAQFVEWPQPDPAAPFVIGVLGGGPLEDAVGSLEGEVVRGRVLQVRKIRRPASIDHDVCDILVISGGSRSVSPGVLSRVGAAPILTVSDAPYFAETGGCIGLIIRQNKIRFTINRKKIEESGLRISSQLLNLADQVL